MAFKYLIHFWYWIDLVLCRRVMGYAEKEISAISSG
jgi:hypothetical protein